MDVFRMLTELREERQRIEEAILSLELLEEVRSGKRRRGRPPKRWAEARRQKAVHQKGGKTSPKK